MKKIGILTYQNTNNFGAALQCYASFKACEKLGFNVEVIKYNNVKITNKIKPMAIAKGKNKISIKVLIKFLFIFPLVKAKQKAFKRFNDNFMSFSKRDYDRKTILENPPKYDFYMLGSDQVWNHHINEMDSTYLMDFVKDKRNVFTYASSFGLNDLEAGVRGKYKELITEIPSISVREEKGKEIIYELTGREVEVIGDPVFLFSKEEWLSHINNNNKNSNNKETVFTYFLNYNTLKKFDELLIGDEVIKEMQRIKLAGGITIKDFISNKTKLDFFGGPLEFIKYINESKYIFTDSFHATVFSILFNKKFMVFLSGDKGRDSRIVNLLEQFKLTDRIFRGKLNNIDNEIDVEIINRLCEQLNKKGNKFLELNLNK